MNFVFEFVIGHRMRLEKDRMRSDPLVFLMQQAADLIFISTHDEFYFSIDNKFDPRRCISQLELFLSIRRNYILMSHLINVNLLHHEIFNVKITKRKRSIGKVQHREIELK